MDLNACKAAGNVCLEIWLLDSTIAEFMVSFVSVLIGVKVVLWLKDFILDLIPFW